MTDAREDRAYLPVGLDVRGRPCLVVGGGHVGWRKTQDLLAAGAVVTVISPHFIDELRSAPGSVTLVEKEFTRDDVAGMFLVVAATGDEQVNRRVHEAARDAGILVNVVDDAGLSDFIFPSVLSRGLFQVAVLTGGASPTLGQRVRDRLAAEFGPEYGEWAALLAAARPRVRRAVDDPVTRRRVFASLACEDVLAAIRTGGAAGFEEKVAALLGQYGRLYLGTRGSALARAQADTAAKALAALGIGTGIEQVIIKTTGDRGAALGTVGLFVREIEHALLAGEIDLAVHSLKDLPVELPPGLSLAAVLARDDPRDVLVSRDGRELRGLRPGARVGTSSLRRRAEIKAIRPDLEVVELRGNVDTRLRKLDNREVDALVLAGAALVRLGWQDRVTEWLAPQEFTPAPGQGALAIEARAGWEKLLSPLDHAATRAAVEAERAFLAAMGGGCALPLGAYGTVGGSELHLHAFVGTPDGARVMRANLSGPSSEPRRLGESLARRLLDDGAGGLLAAARWNEGRVSG